ncbi:MAG: phytoene desaturase [Candidatus Parcubacteria bacterium]|nr:MAG: phytoene desaturase [Candidatus Parcubacteria bacterium]
MNQKIEQKLKKVMFSYGKHYYYATLFFPKKIRNQVIILYAFVRRLDNIVDDFNLTVEEKIEKFKEWESEWLNVINGRESKFEELNLFYEIVKEKNIDMEYIEAFIRSMRYDLKPVRIKTFDELKEYIFGSAVVVGYFMLYIFDYFREELKEYAAALAEAMQLTNFIRDIKEDLRLNRIYIPEEIYSRFNITEKDFFDFNSNKNFRDLIKYLIEINFNMYKKANQGIKILPSKVRFSVLYASKLYSSILDEIKNNQYDVFSFSYKLRARRKFSSFLKTLLNFITNKY